MIGTTSFSKIILFLFFVNIYAVFGCSQIIKDYNDTNNDKENYVFGINLLDSIKKNISIKLLNGKTINLSEYPVGETDSTVLQSVNVRFLDVDKDSVPELAASFNYGGNAAIDQDCFFIKKGKNLFEQVYLVEGGTEVKFDTLKFTFDSQTKYFHTCAACTIPTLYDLPAAQILLKSDGLYYCNTNYDLNNKIEANLSDIKNKGIEKINPDGQDNGARKFYCESMLLYYFNNYGNLNKTKELFDNYYQTSDKANIWNEIANVILEISKNFKFSAASLTHNELGYSKNVHTNESFPNDPLEMYKNFKSAITNEDFNTAQTLIHSDGVYFFDDGRLSKKNFTKTTIDRLRKSKILLECFKPGKLEVADNFGSAMGGSVSSQDNPHQDFENAQSNGGFFKKGSRILTNRHGGDGDGSDALVIEFYKDNGNWKIYSIYKWVWSVE